MRENEAWIEEELRSRRGNGQSMDLLLWRLRHIRDVMERCFNYNHRCLRYWQFREEEALNPPALDHAVLAWLSSVSSRC